MGAGALRPTDAKLAVSILLGVPGWLHRWYKMGGRLEPSALAGELTQTLSIPVIGIGAGAACSGQVLVLHDMLGLGSGRKPRFVRNFMLEGGSIASAISRYVSAVKDGSFPQPDIHTY